MMFRERKRARGGWVLDAIVGAASGAAASWVMEKAQGRIMSLGSEETLQREKDAQGDAGPATVVAAQRAAHAVGKEIPDARTGAAGEAVHYATGAAFGALFGILSRRIGASALLAGAAFGAAVWLVNDETLVPLFGFSRKPWKYPASAHAKALASHLVYGTATGAGVRLLGTVVH